MATEKYFCFDEQGELKRIKGRLVRFLDNEAPTGSDKSAIRTSLEVSPDAEGLVQADIGTAPNEIPVNGMLGSLAYQSADSVAVAELQVESTTGTATTQALTVTDGSTTGLVVQGDGKVSVRGKVSLNVDGSASWGSAEDYGKLTWDTGKAIVRGESGKSLSLGSNGTQDHIIVDTSGRVGIANSSMSTYNSNANNLVVGSGSGSEGLTIASGTTGEGGIYFADGTTGNQQYRGYLGYGHTNDELFFGTDGVTKWKLNTTGNLVPQSSGLGIDFGSGVGTTISDYEFGGYNATLTPATSGTITVYTASDRLQYTRVGDLVSITGKITTTAVSSPVGDYVQLNVPFAIGNLTESAGHFSGSCVIFNATGTMGNYSIIGIEGDSFVRIYKNTSNAASATAPDFSGNESVYVGFSYHTA